MFELLQNEGIGLNELAVMFNRTGSDRDDWQQLMQLLGYSVSGYGDLSSHDPTVLEVANLSVDSLLGRKS